MNAVRILRRQGDFEVDLADADWRRSQIARGEKGAMEVTYVDGYIVLRHAGNPDGPVLIFTVHEWEAFLDGAKNEEFDDLVF